MVTIPTSMDGEMKSALALRDHSVVRKTRIQLEGKIRWTQKKPMSSASLHLPFYRAQFTSSQPQHRNRCRAWESLPPPRYLAVGPAHRQDVLRFCRASRTEQRGSWGPQVALRTNLTCLSFWTWLLYKRGELLEKVISKEKRPRMGHKAFLYERKASHGP